MTVIASDVDPQNIPALKDAMAASGLELHRVVGARNAHHFIFVHSLDASGKHDPPRCGCELPKIKTFLVNPSV
jgi:hypothetical protein